MRTLTIIRTRRQNGGQFTGNTSMKTETSGDINALSSGSNIGRNWTKCICPNINFQRGNMEGLSMWARPFMRMDEKSKKGKLTYLQNSTSTERRVISFSN